MPRKENSPKPKPQRSSTTEPTRENQRKSKTPPKRKGQSSTTQERDIESRSMSKNRENKIQRRYRPTEKALAQIRKYKKITQSQLTLRKLPFQRLVRDIANKLNPNGGYRWTSKSLEILQSVTEDYMINLLEDSYQCTLHAKRVTLMSKDLILARRIRGVTDPGHPSAMAN